MILSNGGSFSNGASTYIAPMLDMTARSEPWLWRALNPAMRCGWPPR